MKKMKIIGIMCVIVLVLVFPVRLWCVKQYNNYKEKRLQKMEELNVEFDFWLCLSGDYNVYYNKVERIETRYDMEMPVILICYYNHYNNDDLTYSQLLEQYENFCDGGNDYEDLMKYIEFMDEIRHVYAGNMEPGKYDWRDFVTQARIAICEEYDVKYKFNNITEEQMISVCEKILSDERKLYVSILNNKMSEDNSIPYPLMYRGFTEGDIEINEAGEMIVEMDGGKLCYYLDYGNVSLLDDEEVLYVKKVELYPGTDYRIMCRVIGATREYVKDTYEVDRPYGFELQSESDEELVYVRDCFVATIQFQDDVSVKMTFEYVD